MYIKKLLSQICHSKDVGGDWRIILIIKTDYIKSFCIRYDLLHRVQQIIYESDSALSMYVPY